MAAIIIGATSDDAQMTAVLFDVSLNDVLIEKMNPLLREYVTIVIARNVVGAVCCSVGENFGL